MTAFHTAWTKPFFAFNPPPFYLDGWDILTTMLSALEWRRHNGGIKMITDNTGAEYYRKLGIDHIWNLGVETLFETAIDGAVKPLPFWAAGKIYALRSMNVPCAMIDIDFIIWKPVNALVENAPLSVIHREKISDAIYPPKTFFIMNDNYVFPETWDWSSSESGGNNSWTQGFGSGTQIDDHYGHRSEPYGQGRKDLGHNVRTIRQF